MELLEMVVHIIGVVIIFIAVDYGRIKENRISKSPYFWKIILLLTVGLLMYSFDFTTV